MKEYIMELKSVFPRWQGKQLGSRKHQKGSDLFPAWETSSMQAEITIC